GQDILTDCRSAARHQLDGIADDVSRALRSAVADNDFASTGISDAADARAERQPAARHDQGGAIGEQGATRKSAAGDDFNTAAGHCGVVSPALYDFRGAAENRVAVVSSQELRAPTTVVRISRRSGMHFVHCAGAEVIAHLPSARHRAFRPRNAPGAAGVDSGVGLLSEPHATVEMLLTWSSHRE